MSFSSRSLVLCSLFLWTNSVFSNDWPNWRGPNSNGVSNSFELPIRWSTDDNVRWKVALAEPGNSTPVVWGEKIFLTEAVGTERSLACYSLVDGTLQWRKSIAAQIIEPTHNTNPFCSSSVVTDGTRVIAWYGANGIYCYDLEGNEIWKRDLGGQKHIWGYGSSPTLHENICFLNFGPGDRSFLIALNAQTGETIWQYDTPTDKVGTAEAKFQNDDFYGSWSTPTIGEIDGRKQLVVSFPFYVRGFEPRSGQLLWSSTGINALVYTSPLIERDTVIAMGGYNGMSLALKIEDDLQVKRLWHTPKTKQRIGSGAIYGDHIYIHNDPGTAECISLSSGETIWEQRLAGPGGRGINWSSVMIANQHCYTINQSGDCFVFKASPTFELVSINSLKETSNSSIVPVGNKLLIRTHKHLWCIGR